MELILEAGERYLIEFKELMCDSFAKEMVAFVNASGGRIFLSASDNSMIWGQHHQQTQIPGSGHCTQMRSAGKRHS
ncbi:MAG: hypothetical protein C5S49_08245 [Candidatus Methanogaster sp.]|nr:MAG: hypothetical protein C5S49_08245 [ANME-2 cluster archaeon]